MANDAIALPKDRYGECIHMGDEVEFASSPSKPFPVKGFYVDSDGWWRVYVDIYGHIEAYDPDALCHHVPPSVEQVLHEFLGEVLSGRSDGIDVMCEYADKIRELMRP